jgi:hypothetical protein
MPEGTETPPEGGKTFTQEQIDDLVEKRLAREREKYTGYDDLKEQVAALTAEKKKLEDEGKSDSEKVSEQLTSLQKQLEEEKEARTKSEAEALRLRVAQAKGLTEAQARRLQGATREELEADADDLLESFGGKKDDLKPDKGGLGRPKENLQPGASNEDDDAEVSAEEAEKIAERIASKTKI